MLSALALLKRLFRRGPSGSDIAVLRRLFILKAANERVGRLAQEIHRHRTNPAEARAALRQAAEARRTAAVTDADPPELRQELADLLTNETTLLGCTGAKGWQ